MRIYPPLAAVVLALGCKRDAPVVLSADSAKSEVSAPRNCGINTRPELSDEGIGELRIGRTVAEVKSLCDVVSDANQQGAEGMTERVVAARIGGEIIPATITDDKVWRIAVKTPRIRTTDSLGVDTPLRKIAAMRGAQFAPGEDGVYAFVAAHCGLSFRFSIPLLPPTGGQWTPRAISAAHGDAAVNRVLVTECRR